RPARRQRHVHRETQHGRPRRRRTGSGVGLRLELHDRPLMNAEAYTAAAPAVPRRARTRTVSGAALVSGATLLSGVLTYAFHVIAARTLGPEGYGRIAVLWAAMFLGAVVLYRPLEQT